MRKILALSALVSVVWLSACDSSTSSNSSNSNTDAAALIGTWKSTAIANDGAYIYWDTTLATYATGGILNFRHHSRDSSLSDGIVGTDTGSIPGTWSTSGNRLFIVENHQTSTFMDTATYSITTNKLVLVHGSGLTSDTIVCLRQ